MCFLNDRGTPSNFQLLQTVVCFLKSSATGDAANGKIQVVGSTRYDPRYTLEPVIRDCWKIVFIIIIISYIYIPSLHYGLASECCTYPQHFSLPGDCRHSSEGNFHVCLLTETFISARKKNDITGATSLMMIKNRLCGNPVVNELYEFRLDLQWR